MQCATESAWVKLRERSPGVASREIISVNALFLAEKVPDPSWISFRTHWSALFTNKLHGE